MYYFRTALLGSCFKKCRVERSFIFQAMKTSRIVLAAVVALALIVGHFSNASAQTYKRHALVLEGTGTWCGYCPFGAYTLDSLEKSMGEKAVILSFHGPAGYGEPLYHKAIDTLA